MRKIFLFAVLATLLLGACQMFSGKRIQGNGTIITQDRTVTSFSRVEVEGAIDVYVSQGALAPVKLEGDENLLEYVEFIQEGDRLKIRTKNGFNIQPSHDMKIYLVAPYYRSIDVSGACDIIGQGKIDNGEDLELKVSGAGDMTLEVDAPKISATISGSGSVNMKGQTKDFDLDLTGAGKARCYELLSENTRVDISGAGDAQVYASVKLKAQVSGAGSISYKGEAKNIDQQVSGAGSVKRVD